MRRFACALFFLATCGALEAAQTPGKDLCQKNYASFKNRLAKNPDDDAAWTELRVCTVELKRWDEAIQVALAARQKNHDLPQPYLILGLAQMQQKNYDRAVEHFDQSIALKSDQPIAYFQMGMAYLFLNEPAKAAQAAERAVDLDPSNPSHHRQLAYAQLLLGDLSAAEASARKAIALDKDDLAAHKILAKVYGREGNTAGMAEELAWVKTAEDKFTPPPAEPAKKIEPAKPEVPQEADEKEERKGQKQEDYEVVGACIAQWDKMKEAVLGGDTKRALMSFSDYLDTREQYQASFSRMGAPRLQSVFAGFGELYDCEVIFATAHCKSLVRNAAGTVVVTKIRFEKNPDHVWRIRSF